MLLEVGKRKWETQQNKLVSVQKIYVSTCMNVIIVSRVIYADKNKVKVMRVQYVWY